MKEIKDRLGSISPDRRKLLERMLERKGLQLPAHETAAPAPTAESVMSGVLKKVSVERSDGPRPVPITPTDKELIQLTYNAYHQQLRSAIFHDESVFMNLGYMATDAAQYSAVQLPERMVNRNYIKLVLEVIGDCDLTGRRLLDVGCGRGGTIHVVHAYFRPLECVGLDLTSGAIEFCRARHRYPNTQFFLGDAENLPFDAASFDAVTNIESSHHYGRIDEFYKGVHRVLAAGGYFLYATMLSVQQFERDRALLADIGFVLERDVDITRNVLAACDHDRLSVFGGDINAATDQWIADAVSLPGSQTYDNMDSGKAAYRIWKLRKAG